MNKIKMGDVKAYWTRFNEFQKDLISRDILIEKSSVLLTSLNFSINGNVLYQSSSTSGSHHVGVSVVTVMLGGEYTRQEVEDFSSYIANMEHLQIETPEQLCAGE